MATSDAAVVGYKTYTCPHAAQCGGCEWLSVPYPIQLSRKRAALGELFAPFGRDVDDIVGMDEPVAYRHKIMTPYAPGKGGKPRHGMYRRGTHDLVGMRTCLVEHKAGRPILESIAELAQGFRIPAYDENTGKGLLRHAIVRIGRVTGQVMVTLVVNRKEFPRKRAFVAALRKRHPSIESVSFNVNTRRTNAVLGPLSMTAYGQGWIEDELCGCTFRIPADAFYQTNPAQTERLYQIAIDMARLREGDRVLDAYCGIGTIGIIAARQMRIDLVGVESVESAVCIARENARINRVRNASFVCADAGEHLAKADATFDVVILDPPRAGASEEFLGSLLAATPRRIVYISCNPVTQVRDIERLSSAYRVARLVGVDMFPHTKHLETVAILTREKSVKSYAYVNISPSELGMGGKVKKPTYKQIQEYVLKNHGLKVSSLYIANLKDELGLDKQFSYEKAEMSAEKRPKCPPEKREAILDAFRHFGLIGEDETEK